jgi:hypothetical protein
MNKTLNAHKALNLLRIALNHNYLNYKRLNDYTLVFVFWVAHDAMKFIKDIDFIYGKKYDYSYGYIDNDLTSNVVRIWRKDHEHEN